MEREFLKHYETELQHVREMAGEFSRDFPKIAGRLGLDEFGCADPYVERLLEGFAYLAGRVHHRMDREFPRFTEGLLNSVFPDYLLPTPSMTVAHFKADPNDSALAAGVHVPSGSRFQSNAAGDETPCIFQTTSDFDLWPLGIEDAAFHTRDIGGLGLPENLSAKAALRVRIQGGGAAPLNELPIEKLRFYLRGSGNELAARIYQSLFTHCSRIVLIPEGEGGKATVLPMSSLRQVGFERDEALVPWDERTFNGFRLLREYFTFPERFMFFEVDGLAPGFAGTEGSVLDIVFCLDISDPALEGNVSAKNFLLHCAPMCNCFEKRLENIHLKSQFAEHRVVASRWNPLDHEILRLTRVDGVGVSAAHSVKFSPLYSMRGKAREDAYYVLHRRTRALSDDERRHGSRSSYLGSDAYLTIVDLADAPYSPDLKRLSLTGLCTNRDLPLHMPIGQGTTDLTPENFLPVASIRCIVEPTAPVPPPVHDSSQWQVVNHMSLNYLSLMDEGEGGAVEALRKLLGLYCNPNAPAMQRQISGVSAIDSRPVVRRAPGGGPATFIRGLEISVTLNEDMFAGLGWFLLGAVLDRFFSSYVSINTFSQTVIKSQNRNEVMKWPPRAGTSIIP